MPARTTDVALRVRRGRVPRLRARRVRLRGGAAAVRRCTQRDAGRVSPDTLEDRQNDEDCLRAECDPSALPPSEDIEIEVDVLEDDDVQCLNCNGLSASRCAECLCGKDCCPCDCVLRATVSPPQVIVPSSAAVVVPSARTATGDHRDRPGVGLGRVHRGGVASPRSTDRPPTTGEARSRDGARRKRGAARRP